jgi:hypothetical protein
MSPRTSQCDRRERDDVRLEWRAIPNFGVAGDRASPISSGASFLPETPVVTALRHTLAFLPLPV